MNDLISRWVAKAESDYRIARNLTQSKDVTRLAEAICFHYQQCAEKYVKALLLDQGKPVERQDTPMKVLYVESALVGPEFETYKADFDQLDYFGIDVLYPGRSASVEDIQPNAQAATRLRAFVRAKFGLADTV